MLTGLLKVSLRQFDRSDMYSFQVRLNGKLLTTIGFDKRAIHVEVNLRGWLGPKSKGGDLATAEMQGSVQGAIEAYQLVDHPDDPCLTWLSEVSLKLGDIITLDVGETAEADPPKGLVFAPYNAFRSEDTFHRKNLVGLKVAFNDDPPVVAAREDLEKLTFRAATYEDKPGNVMCYLDGTSAQTSEREIVPWFLNKAAHRRSRVTITVVDTDRADPNGTFEERWIPFEWDLTETS